MSGDLTFTLFDKNFFDLLDYFTSNILLPVGGLLISIFAGWVMKRSTLMKELGLSVGVFNLWRAMIRVIVPLCVLTVLITTLF